MAAYVVEPRALQDGDRLGLVRVVVLRREQAAGPEQARRDPGDHADGVQAVGAGEQREARLVVDDIAHRALSLGDSVTLAPWIGVSLALHAIDDEAEDTLAAGVKLEVSF